MITLHTVNSPAHTDHDHPPLEARLLQENPKSLRANLGLRDVVQLELDAPEEPSSADISDVGRCGRVRGEQSGAEEAFELDAAFARVGEDVFRVDDVLDGERCGAGYGVGLVSVTVLFRGDPRCQRCFGGLRNGKRRTFQTPFLSRIP